MEPTNSSNQRLTPFVRSIEMKRVFVTAFASLITFSLAGAELSVEVRSATGGLLEDAVVWVVPVDGNMASAQNATAVMDQKNRTFIPHVLPIQVGTAVRFPNRDNVRHQVYSFSPAKTFQLSLYIGEPQDPVVFDRSGVVAIGCNIHDQMSAWIVVVGTPFFGKSGEDGMVEFEKLEATTYRVHVWHERMTQPFDPLEVRLPDDSRRTLTVSIPAR